MWLAVLLAALAPLGGTGPALSADEALALAFPGCSIERRTEYLSTSEEERVRLLSEAPLEARVVRPYVARRKGELIGTAYFDVHRVRTKNEVLMLVIGPDERVKRIEVLSFAEPPEYLPNPAFYAQFVGQRLEGAGERRRLALDQDIRRVAGATLSARAATAAARRTLAVHRVLGERLIETARAR